jgi:diacylglycerol kinase (ATP)
VKFVAAKKVMAIINPYSGSKQGRACFYKLMKWREAWANELKKIGVEIDIFLTSKNGRCKATYLAQMAAREGYELIMVVGGDGTVNETVNGLGAAMAKIPLIVVCAGNGDDFGRSIGAPKTIEEGISLIFSKTSKVLILDTLTVNGRIGVNVLGVGGIDTRVVEYVEKILKKKCPFIPPKFLYAVSLLRELFRWKIKYPILTIKTQAEGLPEQSCTQEATLLVVGNGPSCGGVFRLTPQASFDDGLLDICFIKKTGRLRILQNLFKGFKGTHLQMPEVVTLPDKSLPRMKSFVISSPEFLPAELDGEILPPAKEFKITVVPKSLQIFV